MIELLEDETIWRQNVKSFYTRQDTITGMMDERFAHNAQWCKITTAVVDQSHTANYKTSNDMWIKQTDKPCLHQAVQVTSTNVLWIRICRTLLHMCWADASCAFTRGQHFAAGNDVMVAILKVWRQIENMTPSIDAYLLEEQSCRISSQSHLKCRSFRLFEEVVPTRRTRWVVIGDQFLI